MKHLGVNYMLIASVVMAAPASAGNSSSKANKITSSISDTEQETSTSSLDASSKSAKASDSSSGNSGKGSKVSYNFMSMQHHDAISMEHQSIGRSGKVGKAFSADGKGAKSDPEAFQSGKSGKYQSLSLQYIETLAPSLIPAPSAVPSLYPSFAAIEEPVVTSKPTEGNFLFGAKTTKFLKDDDEDGDEESYVDDATNDMFETIFGEQDDGEEEDTIIKKKALWQWQPGQN